MLPAVGMSDGAGADGSGLAGAVRFVASGCLQTTVNPPSSFPRRRESSRLCPTPIGTPGGPSLDNPPMKTYHPYRTPNTSTTIQMQDSA